jgi:phosphate transport system protein
MTARLLFNEEMKALDQEIVRMGDLAREMIKMGVQAFLENDAELRTKVEELDRQIYLAEQAIEKHCVEIIALHQPVAGDLRMVTTSLKIITDLNRIGRYGQDISEQIGRAHV